MNPPETTTSREKLSGTVVTATDATAFGGPRTPGFVIGLAATAPTPELCRIPTTTAAI
ncbi:hypothetical protein ACFWIW_04060 [Amycolatopsis sp. NPDC058340]|uniref:hypothetical protein n=1 Tax=Amycolatopsis sp. NPDC058340 TaxID=3346453 RepID=UPI003655F435